MTKESPLSKNLIWYHLSLPLHSVNACSIEVMLVVNQKMDHTVSDTRRLAYEGWVSVNIYILRTHLTIGSTALRGFWRSGNTFLKILKHVRCSHSGHLPTAGLWWSSSRIFLVVPYSFHTHECGYFAPIFGTWNVLRAKLGT